MHTLKTLVLCLFVGTFFEAQALKIADSNVVKITTTDLFKKARQFKILKKKLKKNPGAIVILEIDTGAVVNGAFDLNKKDIPYNLKHLVIRDPKKLVKSIENNFLNNTQIVTFDTSGLKGLEHIGDFFFTGSANLKSFDTSPLRALKSVGQYFLAGTNLKNFHSSGLTALQYIGNYFLRTTQLTAFDISPLKSVRRIGIYFLDNTSLDGDKLRAEILGEPAPLSPADLQYNKDAEFFGVAPKADRNAFVAAWKAKVLAAHPDKNNGVDGGTQEILERWKKVKTYRKW